jgi:GTP cyclohydrolase I
MSRLFRVITDQLEHKPLTENLLTEVLGDMLESHEGLSQNAGLVLSGRVPLVRPSLLSKLTGYRSYPFVVTARKSAQHVALKLEVEIIYSSTCPASAALARQMNAKAFVQQFPEGTALSPELVAQWLQSPAGLAATPHAQRSAAHVAVALQPGLTQLPVLDLIETLEHAIATPVQTSVKRVDEQEFARLNAQHLKFAEDAVRTLHHALGTCSFAEDFAVKVSHWESLHAHNAVAFASKKPQGGLSYGDLSLAEIRSSAEGL